MGLVVERIEKGKDSGHWESVGYNIQVKDWGDLEIWGVQEKRCFERTNLGLNDFFCCFECLFCFKLIDLCFCLKQCQDGQYGGALSTYFAYVDFILG